MTLGRVLVTLFFACSSLAFAQTPGSPAPPRTTVSGAGVTQGSTSVDLLNFGSMAEQRNPIDRMQIDQFKMDANSSVPVDAEKNVISKDSILAAGDDTLCYTMRSYVVARDSKNSDSTHPVSYSTCQKAARYQLRTTEIRTKDLTK